MPSLAEYRDKLYNDETIVGNIKTITTHEVTHEGKIVFHKKIIQLPPKIDESEFAPSQFYGLDNWINITNGTKND